MFFRGRFKNSIILFLFPLVTLISCASCSTRKSSEYEPDAIEERNYQLAKKHALAGEEYFKSGMYNKAIDEFKRALTYENEIDFAILNNIGLAYMQLKNYESAIETFTKAIDIKHDLWPAHSNLATCYFKMGDYTKANDIYEMLIKKGYSDPVLCANLSSIYLFQQKDVDKALLFLESYYNLYDKNRDIIVNLATAYEEKGQYKESFDLFLKNIELYPDDVESYMLAGVVLGHMQDYKQAVAYLEKTLFLLEEVDKKARSRLNIKHKAMCYKYLYLYYSKMGLQEKAAAALLNVKEYDATMYSEIISSSQQDVD